ncbi:hypothetical protein CANARDRAFT_29631 [[Candida] arabinofermentans NRRL YB-2248]|uniref:Protein transport protein SEC23 n=1 Tax=[Candida] arabinofermentans NRRL YB-2248 TaxID=983967 RepID=A0A1E4SWN1_9ASCO|nr:hypothetical protein CANARDRAFT_29631 [[Candida] arabinofermentans NRRL YB-2248]
MTSMQTIIEDYEYATGLRYSWNAFPASKMDSKNCVVPLGCLYQPLRPLENPVLLNSPPIVCKACKGILNPFCQPDFMSKVWTCSLCTSRNQFHPQLMETPYETNPQSLNFEYVLPDAAQGQKPLVIIFVVDLCVDEESLSALKESLIMTIDSLPPTTLVGFITFGQNVNIHELGHQDSNSSYCFNGNKNYTQEQIEQQLGLLANDLRKNPKPANLNGGLELPQTPGYRFIQQLTMCEFQLTLLIESLKTDLFPVPKYNRSKRATGAALNVASGLIGSTFAKTGAQVLLFSGGPCTYGPGSIVTTALKDPIRSHHDLFNDSSIAKKYKKNCKFYDDLASKSVLNGHTINVFIGSYDQVGLSEMECLVEKTGGVAVQSDGFTTAIFKQSLQRFLNKNPHTDSFDFGMNSTLEVKVTPNLKINGLIGHATSLDRKGLAVSEVKIGLGGTDAWKLGTISPRSTYAIYFELAQQQTSLQSVCIQFITSYQHSDGTKRLHVTTSQMPVIQQNQNIINYFDQEAATVLVAREAIYKVYKDRSTDAIRWCDKMLVDLCSNFGTYRTNEPNSLSLPPTLNLFPQFMYHLRRSNFIQIFGSSPDETAFYRHCFLSEDCINSLVMIQPTLTSFELDKEPESVLLDSISIKPDRILLLDTFFHLLIFHGSQIADWRRQGYQDLPDYEYFKEFLNQPRIEAAEILVDRFPLPRFIDTEDGGSQARFLMSKLNPTTSYKADQVNVAAMGDSGGAVILTDDVSLQSFMEYVYTAVVKPT